MRQRQARAAARHGQEAKAIADRLRSIQSRSGHNISRIWSDWISSMALALANAVDRRAEVHARREAEYKQIADRHGPEVMDVFSEMMALVVANLEADPNDLLGGLYMSLELGSDRAGQFFTPDCLSRLMASMVFGDPREHVREHGFITVHEPCIGGGGTVIALVRHMLELGLNPSTDMHVTAVDIDISVLRMAYVQLSLLGVGGYLHVGDTLRMQMRDLYVTPVHVFNGWEERLERRRFLGKMREVFRVLDADAPPDAATGATRPADDPPDESPDDGEKPVTGDPGQLGLFDLTL